MQVAITSFAKTLSLSTWMPPNELIARPALLQGQFSFPITMFVQGLCSIGISEQNFARL